MRLADTAAETVATILPSRSGVQPRRTALCEQQLRAFKSESSCNGFLLFISSAAVTVLLITLCHQLLLQLILP